MTYILLIPIFAILDRWCGGGMGWRSTFRGRPIYYVMTLSPVTMLIDWRLYGILTAWCIWREPAWKLFGGSLAPKGRNEILGTFYRHLLILPVGLTAWGYPVILQALVFMLLVIWAMAATLSAVTNRTLADVGDDINDKVEAMRGAAFGVVAFAIMGVA